MSIPHEYMDGEGCWGLHSHGNSGMYEDPDMVAVDAGEQLPLLSTIGRGPKGTGIIVKEVQGDDGQYRLAFVSDETGEAFLTTPNLESGWIEAEQLNRTPQEGESVQVSIRHIKGADTRQYFVQLPPGAHGSRMYLLDEAVVPRSDSTYIMDMQRLMFYGKESWKGKPAPRPGDIVCFKLSGVFGDSILAFGTVEAAEGNQVTVTSRTEVQIPVPVIGPDGNWVIGGYETGLPSKGDKGLDGKNARVEIGNVEATAPGKPSATITVDEETNTYTLNLGIPEGAAGKAIDVQGGIWTPDTLPDYDDTAINTAFIVHDGDKQFDLYIRGMIPVHAEEGGPWTVVSDWQGKPGTGIHMLKAPYFMDAEVGGIKSVPAAEASLAFSPSDYMADGDLVIDSEMHIGVLGSAADDSGDYTVETMGSVVSQWGNVLYKPFDAVIEGNGLQIGQAEIDGETVDKALSIDADQLSPKWDMVRDVPEKFPAYWEGVDNKPFDSVDAGEGSLLTLTNGVLSAAKPIVNWSEVQGKPETFGVDKWGDLQEKPFETVADKFLDTVEGELDVATKLSEQPEAPQMTDRTWASFEGDTTYAMCAKVAGSGSYNTSWVNKVASWMNQVASTQNATYGVKTSMNSASAYEDSYVIIEKLPALLVCWASTRKTFWVVDSDNPSPTNKYIVNPKSLTIDKVFETMTSGSTENINGSLKLQKLQSYEDFIAESYPSTPIDAVLTTDHIDRGEPSAEGHVYDKDGKLVVDIPEVPKTQEIPLIISFEGDAAEMNITEGNMYYSVGISTTKQLKEVIVSFYRNGSMIQSANVTIDAGYRIMMFASGQDSFDKVEIHCSETGNGTKPLHVFEPMVPISNQFITDLFAE